LLGSDLSDLKVTVQVENSLKGMKEWEIKKNVKGEVHIPNSWKNLDGGILSLFNLGMQSLEVLHFKYSIAHL